MRGVEAGEAVRGLGGVVTRELLLRFVTRTELDRAVAAGRVRPLGRGRYGTPDLDGDLAAAHRLGGALGVTSAARRRGWSVAFAPRRPHVVVPRNRAVDEVRARGVVLHRWDRAVEDMLTDPDQTVLDCASELPFLEAVCVGDSAIRLGDCTQESLRRAAEQSPRTGRARRMAVVDALDGRAANAFESATRVLADRVAGLHLVPQLLLPGYGYPDLRDVGRRLLVECDSFGFHSDRPALVRDTERYNTAAILDQTVLRFAYEHPFQRPAYVIDTLTTWVARQDAARSHTVRCPGCGWAA